MQMSSIRHTTLKNITNNLHAYIDDVIHTAQVIGITTDEGNAVLISEDKYNEMLVALEAISNRNYGKYILNAKYADETLTLP